MVKTELNKKAYTHFDFAECDIVRRVMPGVVEALGIGNKFESNKFYLLSAF